ncbi:hypothetical protein [Alienimonas chondri]|uniref:Secreted protein n=1 Tax=Alienimonas chondri TaxID=2681879 RepID=A0ABX1VIA8_9PLAN|nr:hypothetical protein [Alienimonas chondri]NNJ27023.1 hypothetical protein [Alienimonas chondri]
MRFPLPKTRRQWIAVAVLAPVLTVLFLVSGFFWWSPLNCWHDEVDLNSGRIRRTRYLLYCQIGEQIEENWVSRARDGADGPPDWRRVNTFSPGVRHSPHYQFHGAIHQIKMLELADDVVPFESAARRKAADRLLLLWRTEQSDFGADEFVHAVASTALDRHENGATTVGPSDIPIETD